MDIDWAIQMNYESFRDGKICERQACTGIMNALALSEADVKIQYQNAANRIMEICKDTNPKLGEVLYKVIQNVNEDEGNHEASFAKAAAICAGIKEPKADEYNSAAKGEEV